MSGKGSSPRPFSVDQKTFDTNWDNIFKKVKTADEQDKSAEDKQREFWDHYSDLPSVDSYR
jgi:hypothetical protein